MRLFEFSVHGFRSLESVGPISVSDLAVLVGPNDSGKTACLTALAWLLEGTALAHDDRTLADRTEEVGESGKTPISETVVEAILAASQYEQEKLGVGERVRLRRRADLESPGRYEVVQTVCAEPQLRDLELLSRDELRAAAEGRGLETVGNKNARQTYLGPLATLRDSLPTVEEWTPATKELIDRLPNLLSFSSKDQPDPEAQMRAALQAAYNRILTSTSVKGSLEKVETTVAGELRSEAEQLCLHIQTHCPELEKVVAEPSVSFRSGFSGVTLRTSRANDEEIDLRRSGAGRQQRVTLAIWEWTSKLVGTEGKEEQLDTIIAYDEPDTHLDYERQRGFLDLMHKQSSLQGVQVVLATHSLNLLDRVDMANIISLRTVSNRTAIDAVIDDSHDGLNMFAIDLTQSLGLRNSVLLNEKCFLVVEGETERICFPILFRLYHGLPLQSAGIALMACGGNEGALKVAKFLINQGRTVLFLLDQDSATHATTKKLFSPDKLTAYGIPEESRLYVGAPNELEELFSDAMWAAIANERWPRVDDRPWVESDIADLRVEGKFSSLAEHTFKEASESGPSGKPEMLSTLVGSLTAPDQVPAQLRERFDSIIAAVD